ncbi:DUF2777 family protein [Heyndrickxia sporothermodurans]
MDQLQRLHLIEHQTRAFLEGEIENINNQWVFFDDETDEATKLEHYNDQEIEIYFHHKWVKGILAQETIIVNHNEQLFLQDKMKMRIKKQIVFSLSMLLDELDDDIFFQFIHTLNSLDFSIYDCIFSHNQLSFLENAQRKQGVNLLIFDNGEIVLSVHHHFLRESDHLDRFEFTLNTGKRLIIDKMKK